MIIIPSRRSSLNRLRARSERTRSGSHTRRSSSGNFLPVPLSGWDRVPGRFG